jgi:hypothetical protein
MFVINNLGIIFRFIVKLFFDFVMCFSAWNVNLFKVSNTFHVYKNNDVQCNSTLSIIIKTT